MTDSQHSPRTGVGATVLGTARLQRVGRFRFPVFEFVVDDEPLAVLGRAGSWRIFFGRGQVIEVADGTRWRLRALGSAGAICPLIVDAESRKVAMASPHHGGYAVNGPDRAYHMYATKKQRFIRPNRWIVREFEDDVAEATRTPRQIVITKPMTVATALMCLTLTVHGIPGEADTGVPAINWGQI